MDNTETKNPKTGSSFADRLLGWYFVHARSMPWRIPPKSHAQGERQDPYKTWLSEVMLQQTQVTTVKDYYLKFTRTWPTVQDLADADLEDVLKAWAGLGYYSRARNLKKCAEVVVTQYDGKFPEHVEALKKLPGIGDYTAAAIASIVFDQPVPVLDGNVERVLSRHQRIEIAFPDAKPAARKILEGILDRESPGEFAQAMMDLGATICSPKRPTCALCPVNADCLAYKNGDPEVYPIKKPKGEKPVRKGAAFVALNSEGHVFLCKRAGTGLLANMTQVPTTGWTARNDGATGSESAPFGADWENRGHIRHTFTHFHLELEVWVAHSAAQTKLVGWWCSPSDLKDEALPSVMKKAISKAL